MLLFRVELVYIIEPIKGKSLQGNNISNWSKPMKKQKLYKAVFRTKIDFRYDDEPQKPLLPGHSYYLNEGSNEKVSYDDIANETVRIINTELKPELQKYTDISIEEVQVQDVYEGSIEIIYTVILGFLDLVGGLKDLYDTIRLIREISERHINKKLSDRFGRHFKVDTYVIAPESRDYWRFEKEMLGICSVNGSEEKRDAFFYYLLVANIVLLIIVGALVFGAVKAVYFG